MLNFFRILRSPEGDESGGFGEAIVTALDAQEKETPATPETPEAPKEPETPPAWDKTERRKSYEGEKRRASDKVDTDPETELDFEFEAGKGKAKMKLSELRDTAKWIHDNKGTLSSMLKHREMVTKYPEFGKVMNAVIEKSFTGNELNKDFVTKTLASLEGKAERIEEKLEDKDELIDEMQTQLDDLDPDSPQAKILKKSIVYQKGLKAELRKQMSEGQKRIDALEAKLNGVEKKHTEFLSEQDKAEHAVEVKRISEIFKTEFGALIDKEKKDGYKFIDDDEKKEFDSAVRQAVANGSKDIKGDAEFVKLIQSTAKAVYDKMSKRRETWVNDYLKKKGQIPKEKEKEPAKKPEEDDPLKGKSIGQAIADEMFSGT